MNNQPNQQNSSTYPGDDQPSRPTGLQSNRRTLPFGAGVLVILCVVLLGGGFVAGMQYQKGKTTTTSPAGFTRNGGFGNREGRRAGGFGTVTAVSDSSITISQRDFGGPGTNSSNAATSKTYSISSTTTITDNGSNVSTSDISVGDTVFVRTSNSTSTAATSITVNPTMGSGPATMQNSTGTTDSSANTSSI